MFHTFQSLSSSQQEQHHQQQQEGEPANQQNDESITSHINRGTISGTDTATGLPTSTTQAAAGPTTSDPNDTDFAQVARAASLSTSSTNLSLQSSIEQEMIGGSSREDERGVSTTAAMTNNSSGQARLRMQMFHEDQSQLQLPAQQPYHHHRHHHHGQEQQLAVLQLQHQAQPQHRRNHSCGRNKQRKRKALVIEDSTVVRKNISNALQRLNYDVVEAMNGSIGLRKLQNKTKPFDIVLCDFDMPVMDGMKCVKQYRLWENKYRNDHDLTFPRQYIVGISGDATSSSNSAKEGLQAGMDDVKSKPITLQILTMLHESSKMKQIVSTLNDFFENRRSSSSRRRSKKKDEKSQQEAEEQQRIVCIEEGDHAMNESPPPTHSMINIGSHHNCNNHTQAVNHNTLSALSAAAYDDDITDHHGRGKRIRTALHHKTSEATWAMYKTAAGAASSPSLKTKARMLRPVSPDFELLQKMRQMLNIIDIDDSSSTTSSATSSDESSSKLQQRKAKRRCRAAFEYCPSMTPMQQYSVEYSMPMLLPSMMYLMVDEPNFGVLCAFIIVTVHTIETSISNFGPSAKNMCCISLIPQITHHLLDCIWMHTLLTLMLLAPQYFCSNTTQVFWVAMLLLQTLPIYIAVSLNSDFCNNINSTISEQIRVLTMTSSLSSSSKVESLNDKKKNKNDDEEPQKLCNNKAVLMEKEKEGNEKPGVITTVRTTTTTTTSSAALIQDTLFEMIGDQILTCFLWYGVSSLCLIAFQLVCVALLPLGLLIMNSTPFLLILQYKSRFDKIKKIIHDTATAKQKQQ